MKYQDRASYLRHHLSKTLSAEVIDPAHLTYERMMNASSQLLELWNITRKAEVESALRQPAGQAAAQQSKDANEFRRFATGDGWSQEDHAALVANMRRIKQEFPAVVSNKNNSDTIAGWLLEQKRYPSYPNMRLAVTTLACEGKLLLNPSAVGIPEDRYGDSVEGVYQISRVNAADLKLMTTPYTPPVQDESKLSADEYWAAHPELSAERYRHERAAVQREEFRNAQAAVEFFLASNRDYARTNDNRDQILRWLKDRNLPMTQNSLQQAFDELKDQLELTGENNAEYGATRVIDMADLSNTVKLPTARQPVEIVERVERLTIQKLRNMSAAEYAARMTNPNFRREVEALLA